MQLAYNLTLDDFIHFNAYYVRHDKAIRRKLARYFLTPTVVSCLAALFAGLNGDYRGTALMAALAALWLIFAALNLKLSRNRQNQKFYRENSDLFSSHNLQINSEGIADTTEITKIELKWKGIHKVVTGGQGIYVFTGAKNAIIVPNSAFIGEHQRQEFLEAIMRYRERAAGLVEAL